VKHLKRTLPELARAPKLLVACDYDGTLAPIVSDPSRANPDREASVALRGLAALPDTTVAVISGRSLRDLAELARFPESILLVGSHGSEFDADFIHGLPAELAERRRSLAEYLRGVAADADGFHVEEKPVSVAFHYRNAGEDAARAAVDAILEGARGMPEIRVKTGKKVIELCVMDTDKGAALDAIRHKVGAASVLFLGDDVTDEDAFARLRGPDVGVKVGPGETAARHRVAGTREVAQLLAGLYELRRDWLAGGGAVPIEHHSLLSDQRTLALVTPAARLVWLCLPRADSPALFAELLGGPSAGYFAVQPADGSAPTYQRYLGHDFVLETRWKELVVRDLLDCSGGRPRQRAGRNDFLRILDGRGRARLAFAPRLDYGRVPTNLRAHDSGLVLEGSLDPIVLRSPGVQWRIERDEPHATAVADVDLDTGRVILELRHGTGSLEETRPGAWERSRITSTYWQSWADQLSLPRLASSAVLRSALVLKALAYSPSGAIFAAATTSLPEEIGGVRNWDYRYCWLRDAALAATALTKLSSFGEALALLDWILDLVDGLESPSQLHPLYSVTGGHVHTDTDLSELPGYRGSRPVRIGNTAAHQVQRDVFGPIVELVHQLVLRDAPLSAEHWRLVRAMAAAVEERWHEPDHGIWELRLPPRHHVHSKVMGWLTIDRALHIARAFGVPESAEWVELRDRIRDDVLEHGWNERLGAFTASYGSDEVDAAVLSVGLCGLLPARSRKFQSTLRLVERELRRGPTVWRYRYDDGLPGFEGGFHLCTSWLIDALHMSGRVAQARALFDQLLALGGPTGLFSEQYWPESGLALGNFPQAYTHIGIIENALRLSESG